MLAITLAYFFFLAVFFAAFFFVAMLMPPFRTFSLESSTLGPDLLEPLNYLEEQLT